MIDNQLLRPVSEKGKRIYMNHGRLVRGLALVDNKITWRGLQNKIVEGPNIIIANHPGPYKDVAVIATLYHDRQLFFTATKALFSPTECNEMIKDYVRKGILNKFSIFGTAFADNTNAFLTPLRYLFARYIASCIAETGAIPVATREKNNEETKRVMEEYLLDNQAIVLFQFQSLLPGRTDRPRSKYAPSNPDIYEFKYGAAKLAYNMLIKHGKVVPITPISIKGSRRIIFGNIKVNIGAPMYITEHLSDINPVAAFKENLEKRVVELYHEVK